MYLCYLDESGHCGTKFNPAQPVEVMCRIVTDATKLFKTQRQHHQIIDILNKNGISIKELKAAHAYRGRKNWSKVSPKVRDNIFKTIIKWAEARSCKFIICPIDSRKFCDDKNNGCKFCNLLLNPYEAGALNAILAVQHIQKSKKKNKGKTQIIFDEQKGHDENLLRLFEQDLSFTDGYTGYLSKPRSKNQPQRLDQIIDVPHFSKSHLSVLIQLADWVAFVVNCYLLLTAYEYDEKYDGELDKISSWYGRIGESLVTHTAIDPPGKDDLCRYFRNIRPNGWTAKDWVVE